MQIKQIKHLEFLTESNLSEFAKNSILETHYGSVGIIIDPSVISAELIKAVTDDDKCLFVAEKDSKVFGILIGERSNFVFSSTPIAIQKYMRVDDAHRGEGIYTKLLQEFYKWAKANKCVIMVAGIHTPVSDHVDRTRDMFVKKGFKPFHYNYFIEV